MIGLHINQCLRMIHLNILAWNVPNFTWVLFCLRPHCKALHPKKTSSAPVGLLMQTKEIFPPWKKYSNEWEKTGTKKNPHYIPASVWTMISVYYCICQWPILKGWRRCSNKTKIENTNKWVFSFTGVTEINSCFLQRQYSFYI